MVFDQIKYIQSVIEKFDSNNCTVLLALLNVHLFQKSKCLSN